MFDPYQVLIGISVLIGLSYFFNYLSKKTRVPSVLFLILTGIIIKSFTSFSELDIYEDFFSYLELLGIIGLIMIVLEAAVDLKLEMKKAPMIGKAMFLSTIVLVLSSLGIALAIMYIRDEPFFNALVYAIPLSVVSSAVLIPSVHTLTKEKKEFLIYESTFSDIIGIMFFNFVVLQEGRIFTMQGTLSVVITIVVSIVLSYFLVYLFSKIKTHIKLFLMLAILALLYGVGKKLHLSSLLLIFIFGLVLNNARIFFKGRLGKFLDCNDVVPVRKDFKVITGETAFLVRTFFFVTFGMIIDLRVLFDINVIAVGTVIIAILYLVRYINFKLFTRTQVFPEIFLAPRGLITILLFFAIPLKYQIQDFSVGILFFVILSTSIIMMIALMKTPIGKMEELTVIDIGHEPGADYDIINMDEEGPHCELENGKVMDEKKDEEKEE